MAQEYIETAKSWLEPEYDAETRMQVQELFQGDPKVLEDSFYRMLEFGTGGLRGIMGAGTNRMNRYTVAMATQGLANYLLKTFPEQVIRTAISFDSRRDSTLFAMTTARVLLSNGIQVSIFDNIRPTPELSFAIRHLGCKAGVMITASHNPKEYNGYKVFWEDGAQVTPPHDKNIIAEVNKITSPSQVKFDETLHPDVISGLDEVYLDEILSLTLSPESVARQADSLKMVYTPLHGTGVRIIPAALRKMGFKRIYNVPDQDVSDGSFPTVASPNPEEHAALEMAIARAEEVGADLVMASDPDADRVGAAVRDDKGRMVLLSGNQTAAILTCYILTRWKELGKLDGRGYCVKTIVTTELLKAICDKFGVELYNVLTGFKYIAEVVRRNEGEKVFICGGEESYGFNVGEKVRDKDAVITCSMLAECAAWLADAGKTLYGYLQEIYSEFGRYAEGLLSVTKKGKEGAEAIRALMAGYRGNPPASLAGSPVVKVVDYTEPEKTGLPSSNVLQFFSEDGTVVTVRPSGTEPKIKYYFCARGDAAQARVDALRAQFSE
ncbi:MAG: phospho-sugar mutase [Bacteroidales bacterium]|nr:phospho-sugar mutase [Bacteroidales bacterium]